MNGCWRHITKSRVAMRVVLRRKEFLILGAGVFNTAKARWEFWAIFELPEVRLRIGIAIKNVLVDDNYLGRRSG